MSSDGLMANPAKVKAARRSAPRWMVTFADMMSLFFALFVLLLSFADFDIGKFKKNAMLINEAFNNPKAAREQSFNLDDLKEREQDLLEREERNAELLALKADRERRVATIISTLKESLTQEIKDSVIQLGEDENGVILRFPSKAAFPAGGRDLSSRMRSTLDKVAVILNQSKGEIVVTGHTDSAPISTELFRSNWSLSTERAVSVVHYLIGNNNLPANRVVAQGLADSRPLTSNDTPDNRALNRRVEILIDIPNTKPGEAKIDVELGG
jgi:chemotaxis protein MotB